MRRHDPALFDDEQNYAIVKRKTVRGGLATATSQAVLFALNLGSLAILGRLLDPADFGIVAMAIVVLNLANMFKELGLGTATVQQPRITHEQVSTLFWLNVLLSLLMSLIVAAGAPLIALFYGDDRLTGIVLALSVSFFLSGLGLQHGALLRRKMQFNAAAVIVVVSKAVGLGIAVTMAVQGYGYWSLVGLEIGTYASMAVLTFIAMPWVPGLPKRGVGIRRMLAFGGHLTAFQFTNYFSRNLDNLLIGRVYGDIALGFYSKAYQLLMLPMAQVNGPIAGVTVPALSRLQDQPAQFRSLYVRALSISLLVVAPVSAAMIVHADLVMAFLGPDWAPAVTIFRLLGISAPLQPILNSFGWLYVPTGRTGRMLVFGTFWAAGIAVGVGSGLPFGAHGVALGYGLATTIMIIPAIMHATAGTPVRMSDIARAAAGPFFSSAVAAAASLGFRHFVGGSLSTWGGNALSLITFSVIYAILALGLFNGRDTLASFIRNARSGRKGAGTAADDAPINTDASAGTLRPPGA